MGAMVGHVPCRSTARAGTYQYVRATTPLGVGWKRRHALEYRVPDVRFLDRMTPMHVASSLHVPSRGRQRGRNDSVIIRRRRHGTVVNLLLGSSPRSGSRRRMVPVVVVGCVVGVVMASE